MCAGVLEACPKQRPLSTKGLLLFIKRKQNIERENQNSFGIKAKLSDFEPNIV